MRVSAAQSAGLMEASAGEQGARRSFPGPLNRIISTSPNLPDLPCLAAVEVLKKAVDEREPPLTSHFWARPTLWITHSSINETGKVWEV